MHWANILNTLILTYQLPLLPCFLKMFSLIVPSNMNHSYKSGTVLVRGETLRIKINLREPASTNPMSKQMSTPQLHFYMP